MGVNNFVVSTPSIYSCLILTSLFSFLNDTEPWSVGDAGFGRFGEFAVLGFTVFTYVTISAREFPFFVREIDFAVLRRTVFHTYSVSCLVPLGVGLSVRVGLGGSGGNSSLLMISSLFFSPCWDPYVGRNLTKKFNLFNLLNNTRMYNVVLLYKNWTNRKVYHDQPICH